MKKNKKVIVVGAGLSGLSADFRLQQAGFDVQVLEAGDKSGGRCSTFRKEGFVVDTGPEIIARSYTRYLQLINDIGLGAEVVDSSPVVGTVRNDRVNEVIPPA